MHVTPKTLVLWAAITLPAAATAAGLPDPGLTPGALNPAVTPANMQRTICVPGYSRSIRPPEAYTEWLKGKGIRAYGYADRRWRDYEEDHLVPLSWGGSPRSQENLWPEPRRGTWSARRKDRLEYAGWRMICLGRIPLREAQREIATNWEAMYRRYRAEIREYRWHSRHGRRGYSYRYRSW